MVPFSATSMTRLSGCCALRSSSACCLLVVLEEALAVQLAVRAGVGVAAGGEQVGGDVAHRGHVGHHLDGLVHLRELGEELRLGVALEDVRRDGVAGLVRGLEAVGVGLVEEDLGLEDLDRLLRGPGVVAEGDVDEHLHRGATLHVGQGLEGGVGGDPLDGAPAQRDLLQEARLHAGSAGRAGQECSGRRDRAEGASATSVMFARASTRMASSIVIRRVRVSRAVPSRADPRATVVLTRRRV